MMIHIVVSSCSPTDYFVLIIRLLRTPRPSSVTSEYCLFFLVAVVKLCARPNKASKWYSSVVRAVNHVGKGRLKEVDQQSHH